MPFVQALILTAFSCLSLIIAIYCLLFMVPVKRFWERVRTLGGGLKGIEAHVDGVRSKIGSRLDGIEESTAERLEACRQELREALEKLSQEGRHTRRRVEDLQKELEAIRQELGAASTEGHRAAQRVEALTGQLQGVRSDLEGLDVELRQSVRQKVADAFTTVESTVLATLEAIQEEILYGVSGSSPHSPDHAKRPSPPAPARRTKGNIITVAPLFANNRRGDQAEQKGEEDNDTDASEDEDQD